MAKNPASTYVHQVIPKAADMECHLRVVEVEGIEVLELRDYILSSKTYGRGYWVPLNDNSLFSLINGFADIAKLGAN